MNLVTIAPILAALLAGTSLVAFGLKRRGRGVVAEAVPVAVTDDPVDPALVADHLAARVEGMLTAQTRAQADALAELKAEILGLKSDVEWLAGERMIEQAIAMAQSGIEAEEIGRELGMTRDAAETIVAFRRH